MNLIANIKRIKGFLTPKPSLKQRGRFICPEIKTGLKRLLSAIETVFMEPVCPALMEAVSFYRSSRACERRSGKRLSGQQDKLHSLKIHT
ncbi:MAG TPA: hypothetical protein VF676_05180 [Flavobacterium sp.]